MKIERNRAARRAAQARRYAVSPVTRAIRSVLTVSAAALAFSGTGLALAKTPSAPSVIAAPRATLSDQALLQIPAQVVDLTVVHGASLPTSVVDGAFDLHAALADADSQLALNGRPGGGDAIDRVLDLTTVPSLVAGPGNGSETSGVAGFVHIGSGGIFWQDLYGAYSVSSATGLADGVFVTDDSVHLTTHGAIDATGDGWAAGIEAEALNGVAEVYSRGAISVTSTGANGQAIGIYAAATANSHVGSYADITATATGAGGDAFGVFSYSHDNTGGVINGASITSTAVDGNAFGIVGSSVNGSAVARNYGYGVVTANGDFATGVFAVSQTGSATVANDAAVYAYGNTQAMAIVAQTGGDALAINNGGLAVAVANGSAFAVFANGDVHAVARSYGDVVAVSYYGEARGVAAISDNAEAWNQPGGTIYAAGVYAKGLFADGVTSGAALNQGDIEVRALYGAFGVRADGGTSASATNAGTLSVYTAAGYGTGVLALSNGAANALNDGGTIKVDAIAAYGVVANAGTGFADANNDDGTVNAFGTDIAYGVAAFSDYAATALNGGDVVADAGGRFALGLSAFGPDAIATNNGNVTANAVNGVAIGVVAAGDDAYATNNPDATITATGYVAIGLDAEGTNLAIATNIGDVVVNGTAFAIGAYSYSDAGDAASVNYGDMDVHAVGDAYGLYSVALGGSANFENRGPLSVASQYGTAVGALAIGVGGVNGSNSGDIVVSGATASGILAFGAGDGAMALVINTGNIDATGESFASGIEAVSRQFQGTATVVSTADIHVASNGDAQGIVAAADLNASVMSAGTVHVSGTGGVYGIFGLSADGDVTVNSNNVYAYGTARDSVAYGVLAQTNNGHVQVITNAYTYAIADNGTGIYASTKWNDVDVTNGGDLVALGLGTYGEAKGIQGFSYDGTTTLTNAFDATLYAAGRYSSVGMFAISLGGTAHVVNNGDVETYGGAFDRGLLARNIYADATAIVDNNGNVTTYAGGGSYGAWARSDHGTAIVNNTGAIDSTSYFTYGFGVLAGGEQGVQVTNGDGASIHASGGDSYYSGQDLAAAGILAYSRMGNVTVGNAGDIVGEAYGSAAGISASAAGNVTIDSTNADSLIGAYSNVGYAVGINASANGDVTVTSAGDVVAHTSAGFAAAIYAIGENVDVDNTGSIDAAAANRAYGIEAIGFDTAKASNHGDITATVTSGSAYGIYAYGANAATVLNDGDITAHAIYGTAYGMSTFSYGTAKATNCDCASIDAIADSGMAVGINVEGHAAIAINDGAINATSHGGPAFGLQAFGYTTVDVTTGATGDIHATAYDGRATGIIAAGDIVTVTNGANITADGDKYAMAIHAQGQYEGSTVSVTNTGDLYSTISASKYGVAGGITANADGDVSVTNLGSIGTQGGVLAFGVMADSNHAAHVVHDGDITVHQALAGGFGIRAQGDTVSVDATGDITVLAAKYGAGIVANAYAGDANVDSGGILHVTAYDQAMGIVVESEYGNAHAINTGTITVDGGLEGAGDYVNVTGIQAYAYYGVAAIDNGGTVTVSTLYGDAVGLYAGGAQAQITNGGDVNATGGESAIGIAANAYGGDATIVNGGNVTVVQTGAAEYTQAPLLAIDLTGNGVGIGAHAEYGNVSVTHDGTVSVTAYDSATGVYAGAYDGNATVAGIGDITAISANGDATGIVAEADSGYDAVTATVNVGGDIVATSTHNAAEGIWATATNVDVHSAGSITATGYGWAAGIDASGDTVKIANDGAIHASITGGGEYTGAAGIYAYGAASLDIANGGDIVVASPNAGAYGVVAYSYVNAVSVANSGSITTTGALASGIEGWTHGDIAIDNGGDVLVNGTNGAVGILAEGAHVTVVNSGTVEAHSTGGAAVGMAFHADESIVDNTGSILAPMAIVGNAGLEDIRNGGLIVGALALDAGDDLFTNKAGGTWNVLGDATDFGAGDDSIVNEAGGTIVMHDASISLGYNGAAGNAFTNAGTISVRGESFIDMGTGAEPVVTMAPAAPIDVLNPAAFVNDGVIDFLDGNPDDVLTIAGDLGGDGSLSVDVSLLNGTSDMLYVDGNLVDSAHQALNVAVLDMPTGGGQILVPVVGVKGESQPGQVTLDSFTIGNVAFSSSNFLDLGVSVVEHLDPSNAAADMFALELSFDGINDTGSLAASIAPGAQSLMAAQVGTFRQRMGQWSQPGNDGKGAWVRLYRDKGTITPDAVLFNLPQEDSFAFDQTNTGVEAGITAHIADGVWIGMSLATGEGKQSLARGVGSDELDGDTIGAHLTWLATNGMYADVSYRWMHFDAELSSGAGRQTVGGDAGAFNVEAGWSLGSGEGLKFVPQVQYTHTDVSNVDAVRGDLADFTTNGVTSERLRAGLELQQTFTTAKGNWTPYGTLSAIREFDGESSFEIADGAFGGRTSTEGTSGMLELGANVNMGQLSFWGGLNFIDGGAIDSVWGGQLGLRYTW